MYYKVFLLLFILAAFLTGCGKKGGEDVLVLRLAHVLDSSHPVHKGMAYMGQRLEELSSGSMQIKIYQSGVLGSERESVELLQLGSLDITKVSAAVIENFIPAMEVYSIPYLFEDRDHYWEVYKGEIGQELLQEGEHFWLKGLGYYDSGFRSFMLRDRAVNTPSDLRGLKIRVMRSTMQMRTITLLGGDPSPMAMGEVYSAIQQGVVDGADGNPPTMLASRLHEVSKYYVLDEHSAPPDVLFMSIHSWNRLNAEQQGWIKQAAEESIDYQIDLWTDARLDALREIEESGVTIIYPDKEPFAQAVQPLYDNLPNIELATWIQRIQELRN